MLSLINTGHRRWSDKVCLIWGTWRLRKKKMQKTQVYIQKKSLFLLIVDLLFLLLQWLLITLCQLKDYNLKKRVMHFISLTSVMPSLLFKIAPLSFAHSFGVKWKTAACAIMWACVKQVWACGTGSMCECCVSFLSQNLIPLQTRLMLCGPLLFSCKKNIFFFLFLHNFITSSGSMVPRHAKIY